jgi:Cu/Ag efflux pump CusA
MLVALTVTPAMSLILLSRAPLDPRETGLTQSVRAGYGSILARTVARPGMAFVAIAAFVVAGLAVMPQLGQSLFPSLTETDVLIHWQAAPGTSRPAMSRITAQASSELESIPGVLSVGGQMGRAVTGDEVVNINSGEFWVSIDPDADYDATIASIQGVVESYPGLRHAVLTYSQERIRNALSGADKPIVVRLYGWELPVLREKAEEIKQAMSKVDGLDDLRVDLQTQEPIVEIETNFVKAEPYGLKPGDVRRAAAVLLSGIEVGYLFEEQKVFDVVVWGTPETRHSLTSVNELTIDTPSGGHVRLGDVADVRIVPSPNKIKREGVSRCIDITANLIGRDLGSVARDDESVLGKVEFPLEYHAELLGEYAELQAAQRRTLGFAIAAIIGIFLLLQACFGSWRLAFMAFLTLPAALVGGVLAAYLFGNMISIGSIVGFLAVLGIAARNGILMINRFQYIEHREGTAFGKELVLRGARERLGPTLMTATTTGLAVLPFVILGKVAGYEMQHPLAVVILGGIVTSTLLNLFVLPALYLRFGAGTEPESSTLGLGSGDRDMPQTQISQSAS